MSLYIREVNNVISVRTSCILILSVLIVSDVGYAFSGPEHRRITTNAYDIAEAFVRAHYGQTLTPSDDAIVAAFRGSVGLSYSELVVSIDHSVDPLRILERAEQQGIFPRAVKDLDPFVVSTVLNPQLAGLRAVTINDMHFQAELTTNMRLYHLYAVSLAARGDPAPTKSNTARSAELFTALAINAIADHLLQDFFAPGHIITPRYGVHDSVALASHDKYNVLGSTFQMDPAIAAADLQPLLNYLPTSAAKPFSSDVRQALFDGSPVPLWGDGDLFRSPRQELLLTLLTARSIIDVLQSFCMQTSVNSFQGVKFQAAYRVAPYGSVPAEERNNCPPIGQVHLATAALPQGKYMHPCQYEGNWSAPPIFGLSIGSEALYQGGQVSTRYLVQVDDLIFGTTLRDEDDGNAKLIQRPRQKEWAITVGLSYGQNHVQTEKGVAVRSIMALPLIHTQLGLQLNERRYELRSAFVEEDNPRRGSRLSWEVDIQTGFSFLKFSLGAGKDYAFNNGPLRRATLFRTGAYLEIPSTLIGGKRHLRAVRRSVIKDDNDID
jgi:hypothetical protein